MRYLFALAALLFALPSHGVVMEWVTVGAPGNAADDWDYGSVGYVYRIGKYEVTNAQYTEFLNAVAATDTYSLYQAPQMGSPEEPSFGGIIRSASPGSYTYSAIAGRENLPVNHVSFYDALRFANWLHNGQPVGAQDSSTTEDGAYTMITETYPTGPFITRNAGAMIFLPSEDEWYKAAYYDASTPGYNPYPFADGFYGATCETPPGTTSHSANCNYAVFDLTDVGSYTNSPSEYATFDQGGNAWEWNEAIIDSERGLRGGGFTVYPIDLAVTYRFLSSPAFEANSLGFRVAMIPECDDGADNDGDNLIDFPDDPGCLDSASGIENPQCQDGVNNDLGQDPNPGLIDFDGGQSIWGNCSGGTCPPGVSDPDGDGVANPDPQCVGKPWKNREKKQSSYPCGLGIELSLLLPPLMWLWRRSNLRDSPAS